MWWSMCDQFHDPDRVYKLALRPLLICTHPEFLFSIQSYGDADFKFLYGIRESIYIIAKSPPRVHDTYLMMSKSVLTA